jgi:hypothetical protein
MQRRNRYGVAYPYQHHVDVENPMFCPNLSGRLKDHFSPCEECGEFHEELMEPDEDQCEMYDGSGDPDSAWVCLACYVRHHKEACGCDAWKWAEKKLVLFMPGE